MDPVLLLADTATRSGISTGQEGPVAPVPEPVLPFQMAHPLVPVRGTGAKAPPLTPVGNTNRC